MKRSIRIGKNTISFRLSHDIIEKLKQSAKAPYFNTLNQEVLRILHLQLGFKERDLDGLWNKIQKLSEGQNRTTYVIQILSNYFIEKSL